MLRIVENEEIRVYLSHLPDIRINLPTKKQKPKYPLFCNNLPYLIAWYSGEWYRIDLPNHFLFDGATILRLFWRCVGYPLTPSFLIGATVHDYLCRHHEACGNNRRLSSLILYYFLLYQDNNEFLAKIMYFFVDFYQRFCGWGK